MAAMNLRGFPILFSQCESPEMAQRVDLGIARMALSKVTGRPCEIGEAAAHEA
jgi:hypothetical protein